MISVLVGSEYGMHVIESMCYFGEVVCNFVEVKWLKAFTLPQSHPSRHFGEDGYVRSHII